MTEQISLEAAIEIVLRDGPTFETIAGLCKLAVEAEREQFAKHAVDIARRAISEEREACAKVCYELPWKDMGHIPSNLAFAAAIRARGNT